MKQVLFAWVLALTACHAGCASIEPPRESAPIEQPSTPRVPGSIERVLVPPQVILAHGEALRLTDAQRGTLVESTNVARAQIAELDGNLDRATATLRQALETRPIDEVAALAAAREVSAVEDEIKFVHLRMLIRVQNTLSAEQRTQAQRYGAP